MKKVLAKEGDFIKGSSPKEAAKTLASHRGGSCDLWETEVKQAIKDGTFVQYRNEGGELGYRVKVLSEESPSSIKSPVSVYQNRVAVTA
jgi:hypothetical protein